MQAVLFDMDGTLVETEELWGDALAALARRHGGEVSAGARAATVGTSMPVALGILYADLGLDADAARVVADTVWVEDLMVGLLDRPLRWRPGARDLLAEARDAGLPTALVTTTPRRLAAPLLARMSDDLGPRLFGVTVCGDEVPATKPHPAPYRQAMAALGVAAAGCVVVEDSPSGAAAGLAAGAAVLAVPSLQPVDIAPGLTLRGSLAGVDLAELGTLLPGREAAGCPA
ncbi:HAD family hydrolase [Geodermatophilus marinus]|uniref:HAD family hydrolase n=1 Tax=Geodermatophilus sp. LHW52908 TaxID=2303986 RepID=UPI001F2AC56C|nr:HAD family phosphatase [Geodermatophilus sp. LHW52908]